MRFNTLQDWLTWQEGLHPAEINLGLERVSVLAERLNLGRPAPLVVTVAGTNGKGSTIAALGAILAESGVSFASYTSPHILKYNERCCINSYPVSDEDFCRAFDAIDQARGSIELTYFEFGTLAALWLIAEAGVSVALLEVGLGGRLDAVNVVDADIAVISSVSVDHEAWLGNDREVIGLEKAGILRQGQTVVLADTQPPKSVLSQAASLDTRCFARGRDFDVQTLAGDQSMSCAGMSDAQPLLAWHGRTLSGVAVTFSQLPQVHIPLDSALAAIQVAVLMREMPQLSSVSALVTDQAILTGIASARLQGRFQRLTHKDIEYIFDVAHNPASCALLADRLVREPADGKTLAIFAGMKDKDLPGMIEPLVNSFEAWFLADLPGNDRAQPARDVAEMLFQSGVHMISVSKNLRQAQARAMSMVSPGDRIVVFGSFYTVAPLLERVSNK
jgi:dihydrofolate synthase/folylpolyglutamate synthase